MARGLVLLDAGEVAPSYPTVGYVATGFSTVAIQDNDSFTNNSWTAKTNTPTPARYNSAGTTLTNKCYVFGGQNFGTLYSDNDEYIPDIWSSRTNVIAPSRASSTCFALEDDGYVCTGKTVSNIQDNDKYTFDTWASKTSTPTPARLAACACALLGSGYLFGGRDNDANEVADNDEYNATGNSWSSKTNVPEELYGSIAVASNNKAYIICGADANNDALFANYEYTVNTWVTKTDCPIARWSATGFNLNGNIYLTHGYYAGDSSNHTETEEYNISDSWTTKASSIAPERRSTFGNAI